MNVQFAPAQASTIAPLLEVSGLTKPLRRIGRGEGHGVGDPPGRNPGPDRAERVRQVYRDEADHGDRAAKCRHRPHRWGGRGGLASHRIARQGVGLVFQHSRPLHRQTVGENIKLALLPDALLKVFADPAVETRARAIAERVGLGAVYDRRPPPCPSPTCAGWNWRRPSRATPRWCWSMNPSRG